MARRRKKRQNKQTVHGTERAVAGGGEALAFDHHHTVLIGVLVVAAIYLAVQADRDWIPHDEGTLAHAAERVLEGELPHRDFDDPYTGGLAMLHALAFRLFGLKLITLRYVLLFFALGFVAAVYSIASRVATPLASGLVTLLCACWTVPNYFAAMPSWYNLFFATFGTLAMMRHMETDRRRWLLIAGLCGGLSFLAKSSGLYFIAAALLFLVYREQVLTAQQKAEGSSKAFGLFAAGGLLAFALLLIALVLRRPSVMDALHFAVPGLVLVALLLYGQWKLLGQAGGDRWRRLARMLVPFGCGVLVPVAVFLIPYVATSSLLAWYEGVFVVPQQRFEYATLAMPPVWTLAAVLPMACLLVGPLFWKHGLWKRWLWKHGPAERFVLLPLAILLGAALSYGAVGGIYHAVWYSLRPLVPLISVLGCAVLLPRFGSGQLTDLRRQQLFLLVAVAAMVSLVQFPFAGGIYFCYIAPPAILAMTVVVGCQPGAPKRLLACCLAFYLLFAVCWLNWSSTYELGFSYQFAPQDTPLGLERGGLTVSRSWARLYRRLVAEVHKHSREGEFIYATPDAPDVYFLTGRGNPTRTLFDVFDADYKDPARRTQRILDMLDQRQVNVVVVRLQVEFTRRIDRGLLGALAERYPQVVKLAPSFLVLWREPDDGGTGAPARGAEH